MAKMNKHVCINCTFFEEGICIAHSQGYEAHVSYPNSHGENCKDFEAYDSDAVDVEEDQEEDDWEW